MSNPCVIEISDIALSVADASGLRHSSACCAVVEGRELLLGDAARARARLNPRQTHERFWAQLDQQPLLRPAGTATTHADLAWFHLHALWQQAGRANDEVIFAVPPDWDRQQLALLLGIAKACEIRAVGLVAAPVAAASNIADGDSLLYLDTQWQRVRGTHIGGEQQRALGASLEASKRGMSALYDSWAALIAEHFLHETRFDPLHRADSEQLLYARLPDWLHTLRDNVSATLSLDVGARVYRVEMSRQSLVSAVAADYQALVASARGSGAERIVLGHRLACFPGLADAFEQHHVAATICAQDAVMQGVLRHFGTIRSDSEAPAFVTRLARVNRGAGAVVAPVQKASAPPPSHVLHGWRALPLSGQPLPLGGDAGAHGASVQLREGEAWLHLPDAVSAQVNGEPAVGDRHLIAGDRLRLGEAASDWQFIVVDAEHGTQ